MKLFSLTPILLLSISLCSAFDVFGQTCDKWGCIAQIEQLYVNAEGSIYVGTDGDETQANCKPVANVFFTLKPSATNAKEVYSGMLAAFVNKQTIQIRVHERPTTECVIAYIRLSKSYNNQQKMHGEQLEIEDFQLELHPSKN